MWDRVRVRCSWISKCTIIATWVPVSVAFWDHAEWGSLRTWWLIGELFPVSAYVLLWLQGVLRVIIYVGALLSGTFVDSVLLNVVYFCGWKCMWSSYCEEFVQNGRKWWLECYWTNPQRRDASIGWGTSAIMKTQWKHHHKLRPSVNSFWPYVLMEKPLDACSRVSVTGRRRYWPGETGITFIWALVSIGNPMELDRWRM